MVCSSNWPRLFFCKNYRLHWTEVQDKRAAISEMMGAMVWHLAKYSLAWFLSTYLSWQMVMTPGKMEIFPQQATDVGKLRAHNREAWLGEKDQDDVANPRSGFLLEGDVAHVKGHLGAVLGRPVILKYQQLQQQQQKLLNSWDISPKQSKWYDGFWQDKAYFESRQNCLNCSISRSVALMSPVSASRGSNIESEDLG